MAVIYTISHPFTNEIVYIGVTVNFNKRKLAHCKKSHNAELNKWIDELFENYMFPKIEILKEVNQDEMFIIEKEVIKEFKNKGCLLFNSHNFSLNGMMDIDVGGIKQIHVDKLASFKASAYRYNKENESFIKFKYRYDTGPYFIATRVA